MTSNRLQQFARCGLVTLAAFLGLHKTAAAQVVSPGPQVVTFYSDVDDTEQPYGLYLPKDFDPEKAYPLVISLHGAGSNHRLNLKRVFGRSNVGDETDVEASRYFPEFRDVPFIVASPLARGTMGYQGIAEKDVLDVLADVKRRFKVDEDRTYLTGLSMGGGGSLWIGLTRPDVWAAIAPVCPAPPENTGVYIPNGLNIPFRFTHGVDDPVVSRAGVQRLVEQLKGAGASVEYEEFDKVGHASWVPAYEGARVFDWFAEHKRDRFPQRVHFVTQRYQYANAYWLRIDQLTPGTPAEVDAAFTGPNEIQIDASGTDGFTLSLAGHSQFAGEKPVKLIIGGQSIAAEPDSTSGGEISLRRESDGWVLGKYAIPEGRKQAGAEGPLSAAVASRHVYVYGTAGTDDRTEIDARRRVAERAADWSVYRGSFMNRVLAYPRVLADREVRASDLESANLVLFGTEETNAVIKRLAGRLPVKFTGDPEQYGMAYVYPIDGRYVLISSGLPWWTRDAGGRAGSRFGGDVVALQLSDDHDFRLFKGSSDAPQAEFRFDSAWQVPAGRLDELIADRVVSVTPASPTVGAK